MIMVSPGSSFGGAPFARLPVSLVSTTPADAKTGVLSRSCRSERHGRGRLTLSMLSEEAEEASAKAKLIAGRKRAEEIAAAARGDTPKPKKIRAVKKPSKEEPNSEGDASPTTEPAKPEATKADTTGANPPKAKTAKAKPSKAKPTGVATTPKKAAKKASSMGGLGGWNWGMTPGPKKSAAPASAPAKATPVTTGSKKEVEPEKAATDADKEGEKATNTEDQDKATEEETAKAQAATAKAEAAAKRAAQEQRARDMAAEARGDAPKVQSKVTKAAPKVLKGEEGATGSKGKSVANEKEEKEQAVPKTKSAKTAESMGDKAKKADPKKKKDVDKTQDESGGSKSDTGAPSSLILTKPETIVVVTGATGRVGSLVVRRVLELYPNVLVRAIVNDLPKGNRLLKEEKDKYGIKLEIMSAELGGMRSANKIVAGASAVLFCASGYAQNLSPIQRLANAVRLALNPSSVADVEGVRDVATALKATKKLPSKTVTAKRGKVGHAKDDKEEDPEPQPLYPNAPRFVLLSSAAVTRPNWTAEEKQLYPLAADVPIVKLNPLNILTVKAEGEKELREVGIPYAVVRPCGLNDDHPKGRPLFSVGDTAAGRICRDDVADILVRCLGTPEATGKTFEVQSLPGFEKVAPSVKNNDKGSIDQALSMLPTDEALESDPNLLQEIRRSSYPILTQLRPLPMGQRFKEE